MSKNTTLKVTKKLSTRLITILVVIQVLCGIGIGLLLQMEMLGSINQLEEQIIDDKKENLKIATKLVHKTIDNLYKQSQGSHFVSREYKKQLVSVVESAISLLNMRYKKLTLNTRNTDEDIQKDLIEFVKSIHFDKGKGYLWIHNRSNIMLAHGMNPSLQGRNLTNLKDAKGKLFFRQLTEKSQLRDGGFVEYYWPSPGRKDPQLKLSYAKQFIPYNWIIGTEVSIGEVKHDKLADIKELISTFRYTMGLEKQNYFWINDLNHKIIVHPFNPESIGQDNSDRQDTNGKYMFREFVTVAQNQGEGFVDYYWPRPDETQEQSKLSFVKLFEPLGWVIGTGVYLEDISDHIIMEENKIKSRIYQYILLMMIAIMISIGVTFYTVKGITNPLGKLVTVMEKLSLGDLRQRVNIRSRNEIGRLSLEIDKFIDRLTQITRLIQSTTNQLEKNSSKISVVVEEQSAISNKQTESVTIITSTVEELSASSKRIAKSSSVVLDMAKEGLTKAELGVISMNKTAKEMEDIIKDGEKNIDDIVKLGEKSQEINTVMEIINNIADQTKLIAFNAALEASSAGEAGKRFNVVAVEIRRLADNVMESTSDIAKKINEIQESINLLIMSSEKTSIEMSQGKEAQSETIGILQNILEGAKINTEASKQISISTHQQETASEQVVIALKEISEGSTQNAKAIDQTVDITKLLLKESAKLKKAISIFEKASNS
jgi:methyl-accepting chemotaxis protein